MCSGFPLGFIGSQQDHPAPAAPGLAVAPMWTYAGRSGDFICEILISLVVATCFHGESDLMN